MLEWAADNGGYDAGTWYWGALASLSLLAGVVLGPVRTRALSGPRLLAVILLSAYVAWSYLSIAWSGSPGDALQGSNRALLYLLLFVLMSVLPWTPRAAMTALVIFAVGVGVITIVLLFTLASRRDVSDLFVAGRLAAPTGYLNSTAALFTMATLLSTVLATRREIPGLLRGALLASAAAELQLAVMVQSRGWLFTLPLVAFAVILVARDRLRVSAAALIPVAATVVPVRSLLHVYGRSPASALDHAANQAAHRALLMCAAALFLGTLASWGDSIARVRAPRATIGRVLGGAVALVAVIGVCIATAAVTRGHPLRFASRQWHGFTHPGTDTGGSHFSDVGSGRYDFWRVSLDGFRTAPIGGLGQDNFADFYILHRRTAEEPAWAHSLEMRLLVHTGLVGFALFAGFIAAALAAALGVRRRGDALASAIGGAALIPLSVWLIHGSVDWFWEVPALAGPALGFLAMASALPPAGAAAASRTRRRRAPARVVVPVAGLALLAATAALGFPYLSARESGAALGVRGYPDRALSDLSLAADLNPLSAEPGRLGGAIALQTGRYPEAVRRFSQAIGREPGGWFAWFGRGLAESALGEPERARRDLRVAASIESRQRAVTEALARVDGRPLTPAEAFRLLTLHGGV